MLKLTHIVLLVAFTSSFCGCFEGTQNTNPSLPEREATMKTPANNSTSASTPEGLRLSIQGTVLSGLESLEPVIEIPRIQGWTTANFQVLPEEEFGFFIGFRHESGLTLTLYQYSLGHKEIPNTLGKLTNTEMKRAVSGIQQAVQAGAWKAARQIDSGESNLGDSSKTALWSRHILELEDFELASDTYVWAYNDRIFKVRSTGDQLRSKVQENALTVFLSNLGNACPNP